MSGYSYGDLHYDFELKIDLGVLIDKFISKLGVDCDEYWMDDNELTITGTGKCRFKHWHCNATYYDPPEDETELIDSLYDKDIEKALSEALDEYKEHIASNCVSDVTIDEEPYEYEADEPDPDRAYDEWRDRQLEGDYE